jgi:hypothetical protein
MTVSRVTGPPASDHGIQAGLEWWKMWMSISGEKMKHEKKHEKNEEDWNLWLLQRRKRLL